MPTLPTDIVAGQAGHVGHSNELHAFFNEPLGDVDFVKRYDPTSTTGASDETVKLQQAITENVNNTIYLNGTYTISAPLLLPTNTRLARGIIRAHASFDFSATMTDAVGGVHPVAMLMLQNSGNIWAMGRCYFDRITLEGMLRPNSRGFHGALQQPTVWQRFRVEDCVDYGMRIKGQQASFYDMVVLDCGTGIILENFSFGRWFALNTEGNDIAVSGGGFDCEFYGGHHEFDQITHYLHSGNNYLYVGARFSSTNVVPHKAFKIEAGRPTGYRIIRAFSSQATNTGVAIEDVDRGFTLQWWTNFRGNIHDFDALELPTSSAFTDPLGHVIQGGSNRRLRFGGRYGATIGVEAGTGAQVQAEFLDSGLVKRFSIDSQGRPNLPQYTDATRPVASAALNGTVIINTDDHAINIVEGGIWRDAMGVAT